MKTARTGNAKTPSKAVKRSQEKERMKKKFGKESEQYKHYMKI